MKKINTLSSWPRFSAIALVLFFFLVSCQEPTEVPLPKAEDGQVFAVDTEESELPYLVISTEGKEVRYEPSILAKLKIYQKKKLVQEQSISLKYRGKTSFRISDKKSFNIETVDPAGNGMDVAFFGMPAEEDWRLIGHVVNLKEKFIWDQSLLYNYLGYEFSRKAGRYASRGQFVEIEVNGVYQGLYFFCEKLKRDSKRIDIKALNASSTNITGGYILKIDKADAGPEHSTKPNSYFMNNWDDDARYTAANSFRSGYDIFKQAITFPAYQTPYHPNKFLETYFTYEYPKANEITAAQKNYITDYVNKFETALIADDFTSSTRTYTQYMDLASFVDFFLVTELCRNVDAYRLSTFLQKDQNGKLAMGPVWDMNIGFDEGGRIPNNDWVANYNIHVQNDAWMVPFWWPRLLTDPVFKQAVKARWQDLRRGVWSATSLQQTVDEGVQVLTKNGAVERNYKLWDQGIGVKHEQAIQNLKGYLTQRSQWMDSQIGSW